MKAEWGSDAIAAIIRKLDFGYATLNPGASYRGLHDSLVNFLGNENPTLLLCLHEEHAIAIAHGFAKVTGRPLLSLLHSNVGLMHGSMAIYNAFLDRVPMVIIGADGPLDAAKRRPWIDWIHTTRDTGSQVRDYTKWDDRPGSVEAALESILRAHQIACTLPYGPTYVVLDADMQEEPYTPVPGDHDVARYAAPKVQAPGAPELEDVLARLRGAKRPLILAGRVSRSADDWERRVALAERLSARVVTDLKVGAAFPTDHELHVGPASAWLKPPAIAALRSADVILSLDYLDLGGTLKQAFGRNVGPSIIACSLDRYVHNAWSLDHHVLPPVDLNLTLDPDALVAALLERLGPTARAARPPAAKRMPRAGVRSGTIGLSDLAAAVERSFEGQELCLIKLPVGLDGDAFVFRHPLDYLGGHGVGTGPGYAVGAALALRGDGRMPVAILGDGDYLMGVTAVWTAVANAIPLLIVIANNRSYYNDELHQGTIAKKRGRPVERKWIGQRLDDPALDLAALARDQGAEGIGPVERTEMLDRALHEAVGLVRAGKVCIVDVRIDPDRDERPITNRSQVATERQPGGIE